MNDQHKHHDILDDAEQYQRMFVSPLIEAVRSELRPLKDQCKCHEDRIAKLERNQNRALLGWSAIVIGGTFLLGLAQFYFRNLLG